MRHRKGSYRAVVKRCAACGCKRGETYYEDDYTWFDCSACHKSTRLGRSI